jgi:hypothetical protein
LCAIYIRQIQVAEISEIISVSCYLHGRAIDRRSEGHGFESCVELILWQDHAQRSDGRVFFC